jgi:TRAP-type mannitol/chloroaromatic compound transport system permease small subunit
MNFIDRLVRLTRTVSRCSLWVAGAFMIATVVLIAAEIVLRKLGIGAISGASEVGGFMLAICSSWAFSYTLIERANIRFDILYSRSAPTARAWMDLFGLLALGGFIFTLTYHAKAVLATSFTFGARSVSSLAIPMWIPQSLWLAGLFFLCWTITILSLRVVVALLQRDYATVAKLAGTTLTDDEVERETSALTASE